MREKKKNILISNCATTKKGFLLLLPLFFFFVIQSCSIQKRHYFSGYNFDLKRHNTHVEPTADLVSKKKQGQIKHEILPENNFQKSNTVSTPLITASSERKKIFLSTEQISPNKLFDACDTLVLNNGITIVVKVMQLSKNEIEYRLCDDITGEIKIANLKGIKCIKYANGQKEYFDEKQEGQPSYEEQQQMIGTLIKHRANAALVLAILSFPLMLFFGIGIITALLAYIIGKKTLQYIERSSSAYIKYRDRAETAMNLTKILLYLILAAMAILLILFLFFYLLLTGKI